MLFFPLNFTNWDTLVLQETERAVLWERKKLSNFKCIQSVGNFLNIVAFWLMTPHGLVGSYQKFRDILPLSSLLPQRWRHIICYHNPEYRNMNHHQSVTQQSYKVLYALALGGQLILKWISRKQYMNELGAFIWRMVGTIGGLLWTWWWISGLHKWWILLASWGLLASVELSVMELLFTFFFIILEAKVWVILGSGVIDFKLWHYHVRDHGEYCLLGCDVVWTSINLSTFQRDTSSTLKTEATHFSDVSKLLPDHWALRPRR